MVRMWKIIITIITLGLDKVYIIIDNGLKKKVTEIAKVVERLYEGFSAEDKKNAFLDLCKRSKIPQRYADKFLEDWIIPTSKAINNYLNKIRENEDNTIKGAV